MELQIYPYLDKETVDKVKNMFPIKIRNYYDLFFSNSLFFSYLTENKLFRGNSYLNCQAKELTRFWKYFLAKDNNFTKYLIDLNNILVASTIDSYDLKEYIPELTKYLKDEEKVASLTYFLDEISNLFTYRNTLFLDNLRLKVDRITQNINFNVMNTIAVLQQQKNITNEAIVQGVNTAIKKAIYKEIDIIYNQEKTVDSPRLSVMYYYLHSSCYPYKYRYNSKGDFIVPYGGVTYNSLNFDIQLDYLTSKESSFRGCIECKNYMQYLQEIGTKTDTNDFILAIPPVKTNLLSYNQLTFNTDDEIKLFELLKRIKCKFLLVLNKSEFTDEIKEKTDLKIINIRSRYPFVSKGQHAAKENKVIIKNY